MGVTLLKENTLSAALQVLAIAVLIDDKIHNAEPREFSEQIRNLRVFVSDHPEYSNGLNIEKWCLDNWSFIRSKLNTKDRDIFIERSLEAITDEYLIPMIYASISQICRCDNEMHATERALLKKAAAAWKLN